MKKRLRVFAGPNGSGKTTLINRLKNEVKFGIYINADDIEAQIKVSKQISFSDFNIEVTTEELKTFSSKARSPKSLWEEISIKNNTVYIEFEFDSYFSADIAEFIRQKLLEKGISFTFETVMSHQSKIAFLKQAKALGYRIYLYFISTKDPNINISRVNIRVVQNGHNVSTKKIEERYFRSIALLKPAILQSNRAYIWDNSSESAVLFAEITEGTDVTIFDTENVPMWFVDHVINT